MIGRDIHEKKALQPVYLRRKIGVIKLERNVYLSNAELGVSGIIDDLLYFKGGKMCSLDYKFAFYKTRFQTQFYQNVLYSLLIEKNYLTNVDFCYIVYVRDHNRLMQYPIAEEHKQLVLESVRDAQRIIGAGYFPKATRHRKSCPDCCFHNLCIS